MRASALEKVTGIPGSAWDHAGEGGGGSWERHCGASACLFQEIMRPFPPASLSCNGRNAHHTLAGVAKWIEHRLMNRKAAVLIPSQGTCLGFGLDLSHVGVSLPLFLPPFPSL